MSTTETRPPAIGMLARVRNRRALVTSVRDSDGPEGRLHLVTVEYLDQDGASEETLLWECEPHAEVLEPNQLPLVDAEPPMGGGHFQALVRATRWTALSPHHDPDGAQGPLERLPLTAPLHGAIQAEDFQMVPLWKAMRMPRVALLLADDVGLGKTIEAGLILSELLRRRRVRRVLVLCPASLRTQWQGELQTKFQIPFDIVDRPATHELRRRYGIDANPWKSLPRIIASYDYLKQPDVLESFLAATRPGPRQSEHPSPHLPWDLIIVDEAHNLAPPPIGKESDVALMLSRISPYFEHRLFLTATPHNGQTSSFTGLLEALDPVRFTRTWKSLTPAEKDRISKVVIRRLKSEINERTNPPRFSSREPKEITLALGREERALFQAFADLRSGIRKLIAGRGRGEELAGSFAVEILGKRLLSSPVAFADSWHRYLEGARGDEQASSSEVRAAQRSATEDTADDRDAEGRRAHAARTVGAWLRPLIATKALESEMQAVTAALLPLKLGSLPEGGAPELRPAADARFQSLVRLIEERLRRDNRWRDDERLVVFTEYKTTLDSLIARLRERFPDDEATAALGGRIRALYGGIEQDEGADARERVKAAFNDPADPIRVLIATDTASEGLNLQETARYLLHFDVPWNPARLEQRNGRLDRHGQARDVTVFHFTSTEEADLAFLAYVVGKVHQIREDLGSMGEIFDVAFERRLVRGESAPAVQKDLDALVTQARGRAEIPRSSSGSGKAADEDWKLGATEHARLEALRAEIDLDPDTLRSTLDVALGIGAGQPRIVGPDARGWFQLKAPLPAAWKEVIDDHLRLPTSGSVRRPGPTGRIPSLLFDPRGWLEDVGGRPVFRPKKGTTLLHLGHPIFERALALFARFRFPGTEESRSASRWSVSRGEVPADADALLLLTVEELAVNELRESFHHWVRTLRFSLHRSAEGWELGPSLDPIPAREIARDARDVASDPAMVTRAREIWGEVGIEVGRALHAEEESLTRELRTQLASELVSAREEQVRVFQSRQAELSALIQEQTNQSLQRQIAELEQQRAQGLLFDAEHNLERLSRTKEALTEELTRRLAHGEELKLILDQERKRVLERVLPARHALRDRARLFPVAVEFRFPSESGR